MMVPLLYDVYGGFKLNFEMSGLHNIGGKLFNLKICKHQTCRVVE